MSLPPRPPDPNVPLRAAVVTAPLRQATVSLHPVPCKPGLQFGARYVCDPAEAQVFDYLPESMLEKVKNRQAFGGMLVLDKWLGNANGRQAVFWKKSR